MTGVVLTLSVSFTFGSISFMSTVLAFASVSSCSVSVSLKALGAILQEPAMVKLNDAVCAQSPALASVYVACNTCVPADNVLASRLVTVFPSMVNVLEPPCGDTASTELSSVTAGAVKQ